MADTKQATAEARTQPSQTELRIPDDLKADHEYATRCEKLDEPFGYGPRKVLRLIERIARLEGGR